MLSIVLRNCPLDRRQVGCIVARPGGMQCDLVVQSLYFHSHSLAWHQTTKCAPNSRSLSVEPGSGPALTSLNSEATERRDFGTPACCRFPTLRHSFRADCNKLRMLRKD